MTCQEKFWLFEVLPRVMIAGAGDCCPTTAATALARESQRTTGQVQETAIETEKAFAEEP